MTSPSPNRREFLNTTAAGLAAASMASSVEAQQGQRATNTGGIPLRPLGKTGVNVSLLCLGGHSSTNPKKLSECKAFD